MSWTMGNLNYWNKLQAGQNGPCATAILGELQQWGDSPGSQDEGITWGIRGARGRPLSSGCAESHL